MQVHPEKTPLADDVDFRDLAERYAVNGGDIKNAVLKAATMAAAAPFTGEPRKIHQWEFERAMDEVVGSRSVMQQSLFEGTPQGLADERFVQALEAAELRWRKTAQVAVIMGGAGIMLGLIAIVAALIH